VYEIQGCLGTGEELVPQGFRLEGHELLLFGICDDCAALESA
jgi:Fur family ferric uptake transcriptional regulator